MIGKNVTLINACSQNWRIRAEGDVKIGNQSDKILSKNGHFLKLVTDGEKYYII